MYEFKITGIDRRGKRFTIHTTNRIQMEGINLWRGTKWYRTIGTQQWKKYQSVFNV